MPTLIEQLRTEITAALKAKDETRKSILRLALSDVLALQDKQGSITEEDAQKVVRKIIENNREAIGMAEKAGADKSRLITEIHILEAFLPQQWDRQKIKDFLKQDAAAMEAIRAAKSDGQATGGAMKTLKSANAPIDGKEVSAAVAELRAGS